MTSSTGGSASGSTATRPRPFADIPAIVAGIAPEKRFGSYFESNAGRLFDRIVLTTDPMRFDAGDLIAINMLSVKIHPDGVEKLLLDREFGAACTKLLRCIPHDVDLWDVRAAQLGAESKANQLWSLLRHDVKGARTGVTVISKLMAAKRPRLFPVWDRRVDLLIERPGGKIWQPMHDLLSDAQTRKTLMELTAAAPPHVGLLRRIDVALWRHAPRIASSVD